MIALTVGERSMVAEVRRNAVDLAGRWGLNENRRGEVALIATEAASNLVKHATAGGEILIERLAGQGGPGIEIIAIDRGPGMRNIAECMRDGYTSAGSKGIGLGTMSRLAATFDIYSQPDKGTILTARVWQVETDNEATGLTCGKVCLPYPGERECGDAWALRDLPGGGLIMVADGLGHGPQAALASREACRLFEKASPANPAAMLERLHAGMRATRGAAVSIAGIDYAAGKVVFAGIGNVSGSIVVAGETKKMVSQNGTVGHVLLRSRDFEYPCAPGALVILHSDGLATHWDLSHHPDLAARHPSTIAALLYRDYRRPKDDVTVFVAKRRL